MASEGKATAKILTPVIVPTRDFQGAVAHSIVTIWNALWVMGREPIYIQFASHGYAFVRAGLFERLKKTFAKADGSEVSSIRGLMLDDDILVTDQQKLIDSISLADRYGWNFVAPYRTRDGWTTIANSDGSLMTVEEVNQLEEWDHVSKAGLGFYYGDLPLDYKFHELAPHGGEDLNFFHDNPQLKPRIVKLKLQHLKTCPLDLETPIPTGKRQRVLDMEKDKEKLPVEWQGKCPHCLGKAHEKEEEVNACWNKQRYGIPTDHQRIS